MQPEAPFHGQEKRVRSCWDEAERLAGVMAATTLGEVPKPIRQISGENGAHAKHETS